MQNIIIPKVISSYDKMSIMRKHKYSNKLDIDLNLSLSIFKEGNIFIVYSPSLDLSAYGASIDKAKESFKINLGILLEDLSNKGRLRDELESLGWFIEDNVIKPPLVIEHSLQRFSMPFTIYA